MNISYAQNFEDILLYRALGHIEKGFYIDIGANDPTIDSVTKLFYEKGWSGINVEPMKSFYEKLAQERSRDINLNLALGEANEHLIIYEVEETGLTTTVEAIAHKYIETGLKVSQHQIQVKTLQDVLDDIDHQVPDIHFLKIDVEGAEESVLRGIDFRHIKPWIVVVESTLPNTQIQSFDAWEPLLIGADYQFACFDGLNRYYVRGDKLILKESLRNPVNVFDEFVKYSEWMCNQELAKTRNHVKILEKEISRITSTRSYRYIERLKTSLAPLIRAIRDIKK